MENGERREEGGGRREGEHYPIGFWVGRKEGESKMNIICAMRMITLSPELTGSDLSSIFFLIVK